MPAHSSHSAFHARELMDELANSTSLAAVMQEVGYNCTADESSFTTISKQFPRPNETTVAEVLGMMARTHVGLDDPLGIHSTLTAAMDGSSNPSNSSPASTWNVRVVVDVLKSSAPDLSWSKVMEALDHPSFSIPDQTAFMIIMSAYSRATSEPFPLSSVLNRVWRNPNGQLSFLRHAVNAPPETFTFEHSKRKIAPIDGLPGGKLPLGTPNQAWASIDLMETLCGLAQATTIGTVRQILEMPLKHCPEVLLVSLASAHTDWSMLQREVCLNLIPLYLSNTPSSAIVIQRVWAASRQLLMQAIVDWYNQDATRISRILDICQDLKASTVPPTTALTFILDNTTYPFALELAALAARREFLNIEKFIADRITHEGHRFMSSLLQFLDMKLASLEGAAPASAHVPGKVILPVEILSHFFRALQMNASALTPEQASELQRIQAIAVSCYPTLSSMLTQAQAPVVFGSEVEEQVNAYFQKIYADEQPIQQVVAGVIATLKRYKSSAKTQEQEVFACMVHNLFDEYRFFNRYPDKELSITGLLFGGLIHHNLVSSVTLGIALKYIADSLRHTPGSKLFRFGLEALHQFKQDLNTWPSFCAHLLSIPTLPPYLLENEPELHSLIERAAREGAGKTASPEDVIGGSSMPPQSAAHPREMSVVPLVSLPQDTATDGSGAPAPSNEAPMTSSTGLPMGGYNSRSNAPRHLPGGSAPSNIPAAVMEAFNNAPSNPRTTPAANKSTDSSSRNGLSSANIPNPIHTSNNASNPPTYSSQGGLDPESSAFPDITKSGTNVAAQVAAASLSNAPSFASTINAETLESAAQAYSKDFIEPSEKDRDRVGFIMNNLSQTNLEQRVKELKDRLLPKYIDWFSNYMVVKRAAQEPNFHSLYMNLVDIIGDKELQKALVKTTHYYVKVLLSSERIKSHSGERTLLKSLASWLGNLTLAKNKPILAKDLDLKQLVLEGYQTGKMFPVLTFIGRLLECCVNSKVFKPPNPWTQGLLSLCAEVYRLDNLKLNLKFEIERMFALFTGSLTIADTPPTNVLKNLRRDMSPSNPDFQPIKSQEIPSTGGPAPALVPSPVPASSRSQPSPPSQAPAQPAPPARPSPPSTTPSQPQPPSVPAPQTTQAPMVPSSSPQLQPIVPGPPEQQSSAGSLSPAMQAPASVEPQQVYVTAISSVMPNIILSPVLQQLVDRLQLRKNVPLAVERAIQEIISPVVERSVMIACMTTYELILKDFANEPDETRMRKAAHLMVGSLAGSLGIVTCKEPLRASLANHLRHVLNPVAGGDTAMLDSAVQQLVSDNLDIASAAIEYAANEKSHLDIDKSLAGAYEARQKAKAMNRPFEDPYQQQQRLPSSLPDVLKPKPGQQSRVYEGFATIQRTVPSAMGPQAPNQIPTPGMVPSQQPGRQFQPGVSPQQQEMDAVKPPEVQLSTEQLAARYLQWQQLVDSAVAKESQGILPEEASQQIQLAVAELADLVNTSAAADGGTFGMSVANRIFKHLYEAANKSHIVSYIAALDALVKHTPCKRIPLEITTLFNSIEDPRKYNVNVGEALVRSHLFHLPDLDTALSRVLANPQGRSYNAAAEFAVHLIRTCVLGEQVVKASDLNQTLDMLGRLVMRMPNADGVVQLIEQARQLLNQPQVAQPAASAAMVPAPTPAYMRMPDPPGLKEQAVQLFEDWARLTNIKPEDARNAHVQLVNQLAQLGYLGLDERTDRFLRNLFEITINHCLLSESAGQGPPPRGGGPLNFMAVDALVRFIVCLALVPAASPAPTHPAAGEPILTRALGVLTMVLKRDADAKMAEFNGRPYLRLFAGLMCELAPSDVSETIALRNLKAVSLTLLSLQPVAVPGFAFAWLELISHRAFMPKLLLAPPAYQGGLLFKDLLVALLRFMEPYLRKPDIQDTIRQLYKGTLRVLLVLLHDFPEFLCDYHFQLCDAIPPSCIQMRNLILSAFPRNMRLPDPFTPNLKVDLLPEISQPPRMLPEESTLLSEPMLGMVNQYLRTRSPTTIPAELLKRLSLPANEAAAAGTPYNVPLINALVLTLGLRSKPGTNPAHHPAMDIFKHLAEELDTEGRYLFLNAIANQLRYPNSHTHFYSCVLLCLFADSKLEILLEQITRVLLERLVVNRPHPWGLLVTFIELIKNPMYNFWNHGFTRCAPEIERLFASVASSCMGSAPKQADDLTTQQEGVRA